MTRAELGRMLRSARAASGRSLEDIARRGGVTIPACLHLERGASR